MPNVLLTVDDLAQELGALPIQAQRLIARGRINAHRVGEDFRLTPDELLRYVTSGAPDFTSPPMDHKWFTEDLAPYSEVFRRHVIDAAQDQKLSQQRVNQIAAKDPLQSRIDVPLTVTKAIADVGSRPFSLPGKKATFSTMADAFVVEQLRSEAEIALTLQTNGDGLLDSLYSSPEAYNRLVKAAFDRFVKGSIAFTSIVEYGGRSLEVMYTLTNATHAGNRIAQLCELAF